MASSQALSRVENKEVSTKNGVANFNSLLLKDAMQKRLADILKDTKKIKQFNNVVLNLVSNNKDLAECDPMSIIYAALRAFELNLNCNPALGEVWFISYNNKKTQTKTLQFQMGYKGFYQLAMRSGQYRDINVVPVRDGEYLGIDNETGTHKFHFDKNNCNEIVGYAGFLVNHIGTAKKTYWTIADLEAHGKKYSETYKDFTSGKLNRYGYLTDSVWNTNKTAMYEKTIIKHLCNKYAIKSLEMQLALQSDQAVMSDYNNYDYVDNSQNTAKSEALAELEKALAEVDCHADARNDGEIPQRVRYDKDDCHAVPDTASPDSNEEIPQQVRYDGKNETPSSLLNECSKQ